MITINQKLLYYILNIWLAYITILFVSSYLPHWQNVNFHTWINQAIYFLLFLLSFSIYKKEIYNKDVFFNLSLYLFAISLNILNIFIGDDCLVGNYEIAYYFYHYNTLFLYFLFNFFIIYTIIKYIFSNQKTYKLYLITFILLSATYGFHFYPYFRNPQLVSELGNNYLLDLQRRLFFSQSLSYLFMLLYGYYLYKKDRILGEYINVIMACCFLGLNMDIIVMLSSIYNFEIFSVNQYMLTINLVILCITLFKKLSFLCSNYGQFYESLINKKIHLGKIQIKRQRSEVNAFLIRFIKIYLYQRRNYLFSLGLLSVIGCSYFELPKGIIVHIIGYAGCLFVLFLFIHALYKRRAKQKYILQ